MKKPARSPRSRSPHSRRDEPPRPRLPRPIWGCEFFWLDREFLALLQGEPRGQWCFSVREFIKIGPRSVLMAMLIGQTDPLRQRFWRLHDTGLPDRRGPQWQLSLAEEREVAEAALSALRTRAERQPLFEALKLDICEPDFAGFGFRLIDGLDASRPLKEDERRVLEVSRVPPGAVQKIAA